MVAFSFDEQAGDDERENLLAGLRELPEHFPQMRNFALGDNVSERDDRYSHAFSAEFDSLELLTAYLSSERHEQFVRTRFRPLVSDRAIVSFDADQG